MDEIRALSPTGMLGSGYAEASLKTAMEWEPHFIACDAGSTDAGPDALATGKCHFARSAVKRDIRLMLLESRKASVPLIIGSAGSAGADPNLEWTVDIVKEIASEEHLKFRLGIIHSEQNKEYLKRKLQQGKIRPLTPAPPIDEQIIDRSVRIVGMMGAEPIAKTLDDGAEVVITGRASDTSLFAAIPLIHGFPEGPVWHAAKILECGAASVAVRRSPDCMFSYIRKDHFVVEPPGKELWCTPQSVASHTLYENADPFHLYESSGMLDTYDAEYDALSDRAVKVIGSKWHAAETYTVKLEGVELCGYQSVIIGSVRDPLIIGQIDDWLDKIKRQLANRVYDAFDRLELDKDYEVFFRVYGRNGTMGSLEPVETLAHELCILMEITASTPELSRAIADSCQHLAVHNPIPEWNGLITGLAYPYSPSVLDRGAVYRFNLNHIVEPASPYEMFPSECTNL